MTKEEQQEIMIKYNKVLDHYNLQSQLRWKKWFIDSREELLEFDISKLYRRRQAFIDGVNDHYSFLFGHREE